MFSSMDNKRIFLWAAVGLLVWLNYLAWQRDYPTAAPASVSAPAAGMASAQSELPTLPKQTTTTATVNTPSAPTTSTQAIDEAIAIHVITDVVDLEISTRGGELRRADMLKYQVKDQPGTRVRLLS